MHGSSNVRIRRAGWAEWLFKSCGMLAITLTVASAIRMKLAGQALAADTIEAADVTVAAGARIDPAATAADFLQPFWRETRQWPVLATASPTGSFSLGSGTLPDNPASLCALRDFAVNPIRPSLAGPPPSFRSQQLALQGPLPYPRPRAKCLPKTRLNGPKKWRSSSIASRAKRPSGHSAARNVP